MRRPLLRRRLLLCYLQNLFKEFFAFGPDSSDPADFAAFHQLPQYGKVTDISLSYGVPEQGIRELTPQRLQRFFIFPSLSPKASA